jgi:hypothetical protein
LIKINLQISFGHFRKKIICLGMGKDIVIKKHNFCPVLEQFIKTADLPRHTFLLGNNTERAFEEATPGEKPYGPIPHFTVKAEISGKFFNLGRQAKFQVNSGAADF